MEKPESPWAYKPWWCQPWSILLTGTLLIAGSWLLIKTLWFTVVVSVPILAWMGFFLLLWPQLVIRYELLEHQQQELKSTAAGTRPRGFPARDQ